MGNEVTPIEPFIFTEQEFAAPLSSSSFIEKSRGEGVFYFMSTS